MSDPPTASGNGRLRIDLWCNYVAGGWLPEQLETGLGGSEESLVLWSKRFIRSGGCQG